MRSFREEQQQTKEQDGEVGFHDDEDSFRVFCFFVCFFFSYSFSSVVLYPPRIGNLSFNRSCISHRVTYGLASVITKRRIYKRSLFLHDLDQARVEKNLLGMFAIRKKKRSVIVDNL